MNSRPTQQPGQAATFQRVVMHAFGLRSELRKVFLLCEVRGYSIEETAEILGISTQAAALRLQRARREIQVRLAAR
jgi:DNA-directed RNA polymerase specialized sigma24 family protein